MAKFHYLKKFYFGWKLRHFRVLKLRKIVFRKKKIGYFVKWNLS